MISVQLPAFTSIRADAPRAEPQPRPAPRRPAPPPRREPAPEPGPRPAPAPRRPGNGDAGRIETIRRTEAKAHKEIKKAMIPADNIGWQLDVALHAWRRGVLSPESGPYLQKRIDGISYGGVRKAAEEGAFQAMKAIEGTTSGLRGPVVTAARSAIDRIADAQCATRGQVAFLQQTLDSLLKRKPHPDPCGPTDQAPAEGQYHEEHHAERIATSQSSRRVRREEVTE